MPPNQLHTLAFTYKPPRVAQECIINYKPCERQRPVVSEPVGSRHFFPLHVTVLFESLWGVQKIISMCISC